MLKCDLCSTEYVYKLVQFGNQWACDGCYRKPNPDNLSLKGKEFLPEYGWVERSRLDELERRVILPDRDLGDATGHFVGRRERNGRISDREPSY